MWGVLMNADDRGTWVTLRSDEIGEVSGWLVGEIPQGVLVAPGDDLRDIRLVPYASRSTSIHWDREKKVHPQLRREHAEKYEKELRELAPEVFDRTRRAISRMDFNQLHRFDHQASAMRQEIRDRDYDLYRGIRYNGSGREELLGYLAAQVDRTAALHRDVYESFEESGLADVVGVFGPRLANIPPKFTIPAYDLEFQDEKELTASLESSRENHWTASEHRVALSQAEAKRTQLLAETGLGAPKETETPPRKSEDANFFSRWGGPSLRILAGTGLAAANVAIGLTAGLTGAVATIGATAVPTYVGVVTSVYTGLIQVADGLEKVGRSK